MKIKTKHRQIYLAKEIGVSQATISMWLSGTTVPTGLQAKSFEEKFPKLYTEVMNLCKSMT